MMELGAVNTRTASKHAQGYRTGTVPRSKRGGRFDREGRETGLRNPANLPYRVCPMCSKRASTQTRINGVRTWKCEHCGSWDDEHGPLH